MNRPAREKAQYTGTRLEDRLSLALYMAHRKSVARYRTFLDQLGLTFPQYLVLVRLWERDRVSVAEIGRELDLDSGTLTPLLKRLEAKGLVERGRSPVDERLVLILLSPRGRELRQEAAKRSGVHALSGPYGPQRMAELLKALAGDAPRARMVERAF